MAKKNPEPATTNRRTPRARPPRPGKADARPARSSAPFAITSDGALLINVDAPDAIDAADVENRTLFLGAELAGRDRRLARKLLEDAGHDLRAKLIGARAGRQASESKEK